MWGAGHFHQLKESNGVERFVRIWFSPQDKTMGKGVHYRRRIDLAVFFLTNK